MKNLVRDRHYHRPVEVKQAKRIFVGHQLSLFDSVGAQVREASSDDA